MSADRTDRESTAARFAEANQREFDRCQDAVDAGEYPRARARLADLHWFAHDDPRIHTLIHRLERDVARRTGDARTARNRILPVLFASVVARLERLAPRYHAEALIDAPPSVAYAVLTDFARYPEWNPWLTSVTGSPSPGSEVSAEVRLGGKLERVAHEVTVALPDHRFAWRDRGLITLLAGGNRLRILLPEGEGTRLIVRLALTGPLSFLAHTLYGASLARDLTAETRALADRARAIHAGAVSV
ncbi:SRPBCC domain-containing protein [Nocardia jejuensis]|uniref:SRPBCC domain-containing protein n=1 Tax=Nocardia jejuensis TaxID=328049 RepID=UPI00082A5FD4|nr:SRPBCC domain-containing protein [Nocardia jejuensis]